MGANVPWKIDDTVTANVPWKIDDTVEPAPVLKKTLGQQFMEGIGNISSAPEVVANLATGALGQAVGGLAGGVRAMLPGPEGVGAETSKQVSEALTYQPRNPAAKKALELVGKGFEYANEKLGDVGEVVGGNAGRTIGENALPVAMTVAPVPKLVKSFRANPSLVLSEPKAPAPADIQTARELAPALDAAEVAKQHGIVTNPTRTNPTRMNRILEDTAGEAEINARLANLNQPKWNAMVRSDPDLNIGKGIPLNETTLKAVRDRAAEPNAQIAKTGDVLMSDANIKALDSLRETEGISNADSARLVNATIDRALGMTRNGMDAGEVLNNISQLRKDARTIYKKSDAGPAEIAKADVSLKIANTLEDAIDQHLYGLAERDPYGGYNELGEAYRSGRRTMAKSYALEDALDFNTKQIDPAKIAKMTSVDNALTGNFADMGKIVGNFPEVAEIGARPKSLLSTHFYRNTPAATVGAVLGSALGPMGFGAGGLLGASLGEFAGRAIVRHAGGDWMQRRGVNPVPRSMWDLSGEEPLAPRPPPGPMGYERNPAAAYDALRLTGPSEPSPAMGAGRNAPVPPSGPNWQYGEPPRYASEVPVPPMRPPGAPQLPEFSAEQVMNVVARQRKQEYDAAKGADTRAQAEAEANAAALRKPAKGGVVLGEQSPAPQPFEIANETSLQRAVDKIAAGRQFDLTAEERIAWAKATGTIETLRKGSK